MVRAVRGAIQVRDGAAESIEEAGARLAQELLAANGIPMGDLVSLVFTLTRDLFAGNPATGARRRIPGLAEVPLLCLQEAAVEGSLPRVVRLLVTFTVPASGPRAAARPVPVYLDGAEALRPDLATGAGG